KEPAVDLLRCEHGAMPFRLARRSARDGDATGAQERLAALRRHRLQIPIACFVHSFDLDFQKRVAHLTQPVPRLKEFSTVAREPPSQIRNNLYARSIREQRASAHFR